ncbi:MAG: ABC transporter permease [candidate division Zixibacteria bacterium]|nr:ABC transporter permease [candidate division Zixibacteria bacterium]
MANTWTFTIKELRSFFNSAVAYVILTLFLFITGWFFASNLFLANQADLRDIFGAIVPMILLFFVPAITMRMIAEEKKSGTIELLVTLPVRDVEIVLGKYLAALILLGSALALTFAYPLTISLLGSPDHGALVGGYLGLFLMGAAYLAIGLFTSGLTPNQIVAFITGFVIIFVLFMLDKVIVVFPATIASILEYISVGYHLENLARGVIDSRDVLYYLSLIGLFLFLAVRSLESRKWR